VGRHQPQRSTALPFGPYFVLSNCSREDGKVIATFRQPFDMLAETATAAARIEADESAKSAKSDRTMCRAPGSDFQQILEDVRGLRFPALARSPVRKGMMA
jgi:hypothetical protein